MTSHPRDIHINTRPAITTSTNMHYDPQTSSHLHLHQTSHHHSLHKQIYTTTPPAPPDTPPSVGSCTSDQVKRIRGGWRVHDANSDQGELSGYISILGEAAHRRLGSHCPECPVGGGHWRPDRRNTQESSPQQDSIPLLRNQPTTSTPHHQHRLGTESWPSALGVEPPQVHGCRCTPRLLPIQIKLPRTAFFTNLFTVHREPASTPITPLPPGVLLA
ncbi:hypothetical protein E2C01_035864 [Portunus trituberculatus]|uniref:Uncharacterized protein n=1 Tax=Portunus trituberculatus TaxID=210409 RepID=A0A5B7F9L7_PORTR|nr:hypothetical protein [Portunus trituberculatus]